MKVLRYGNGDFRLELTPEEFSKLEKMVEPGVVATAKIMPQFRGDPLEGKKLSLVYDKKRDRDCGVDCSDMIKYFNKPPIPVYIADRGIARLRDGEPCGSCYGSNKVFIKRG